MKYYKNIVINKFNNYDWSNEQIERVKAYLLYNTLPRYNSKRFVDKYKDFEIRDNKIYFTPLNLEVVPNDNKQQVLKDFYDDFKAIANGKTAFYKKIIDKYLNIKRKDVSEFLGKQPAYQMNTDYKHIVNKPIMASSCGERVAVDLVDMQKYNDNNEDYSFILTAIDYFSRKVWAKPLQNKKSQSVRDGLASIFEEMTITPHILQSDNGREFKNYNSINWLKEQNIKPIFTLSYAPESNGLIENFNKQLRRMIREIFIRTNDLNWINYLDIIVDNKNESYNSTIKAKPNLIWNEDNFYNNVKDRQQNDDQIEVNDDNANPETIRQEIVGNIKQKAKKQLEKNKITELNVGDHVRVKMSAIYSELRRVIKQGNKKDIAISFTPEIYRIFKVIDESNPGYERKRYTLKKLDGTPLLTERKVNEMKTNHRYRRLFASDLLKVDKDTKNINYTNDRANELNQMEVIADEIPSQPIEKKPRVRKEKTQPEITPEIRKSSRIRKENKNEDFVY